MKNSQLLLITPALSSVNRDMTELMNRDMDKLTQHGRQLRSKAIRHAARQGAQWLSRHGRTIIDSIIVGHQRRVALRDLRALNTYQLNDIGLTDEELPAVVDELLRRRRAERTDKTSINRDEPSALTIAQHYNAADTVASNDSIAVKQVRECG